MSANPSRRNLLADAGLRVLAREGARGLTHRAVDREAAVPTGTTANYFNSREALLGALASRIFERLAPPHEVFEQVGTLPPTLETAIHYIQDIVLRTTRSKDLTLALFELRLEAARRPELARILQETLARNFQLDLMFHRQARLPGDAAEIAMLHFAIDGLLLDLLTVPIQQKEQTLALVPILVTRILAPHLEMDPSVQT
ncbi:TetR/AcrR family transcriptional regulator [Deinococcus cellulosilyticus]|uniref:TetR family transcriptional regulator n=1 Tax=Deinococcus cellulosilyticus (strain DSM 18568 / NBRC 106333 / KACC 11606 / 5516J-15) TaxID=1223518 RepID=A0A511N1L6_DEIC1|nr:TetR/AcrR family transcriptional regulator [Deinococcus cellulosilyticus]GEM46236.1 TetR family transcriptional regulator [Deinococcus cellulosilyticus NBRC 106333 = KACC 11606]